MANLLLLNKQYVWVGLGTLTYTLTSTGLYNVTVFSTVPNAVRTGDGAGSGAGLGSGAGGGGEGFVRGDFGPGFGGVGQGFGTGNGYQQPPSYGSNETSFPAVSSSLVVTINDNGSPIYTSPTIAVAQEALNFKFGFSGTTAHVITVVLSSAGDPDAALNALQSQIQIGEGL